MTQNGEKKAPSEQVVMGRIERELNKLGDARTKARVVDWLRNKFWQEQAEGQMAQQVSAANRGLSGDFG